MVPPLVPPNRSDDAAEASISRKKRSVLSLKSVSVETTSPSTVEECDAFGEPREPSSKTQRIELSRAQSASSVQEADLWADKAFRGLTPLRQLGKGAVGQVFLLRTAEGRQAVDKQVEIDRLATEDERETVRTGPARLPG